MVGAEPFADPGHGASAGTAVLCLHGLTSTPQTIRPVAEHLAGRGHRVLAPRLPGHGTTMRALAKTRYDDWLASAESALIRLRRDTAAGSPSPEGASDSGNGAAVERVVVVGISLGGALATDLAIRHPHLVDALALINPAFHSTDPLLRLLPVLSRVLPSTAGLAGDTADPDAPVELAYPRLPLRPLESFVQRWPTLLSAAAQVRCPTLIATSAKDAVVPPLSSDLLANQLPEHLLTRVSLNRSAHVATLDYEADALNRQIAAFIQEVLG